MKTLKMSRTDKEKNISNSFQLFFFFLINKTKLIKLNKKNSETLLRFYFNCKS